MAAGGWKDNVEDNAPESPEPLKEGFSDVHLRLKGDSPLKSSVSYCY